MVTREPENLYYIARKAHSCISLRLLIEQKKVNNERGMLHYDLLLQ